MGESVDWAEGVGLFPNGLSANAGPMLPVLDVERWKKAEERTAELIACIQPNSPSEERRTAVADYVQRLIAKCFACQVFTFGSVPLKTYLPDGDIDLTAFSNNPSLKDSWATQVRDLLEKEEKDANAEFCVQEVQYIQAEVKIIKCLVDNIVVDISFNQLGGLCTLCFLEEVDNLISQDHLFKRSIILIKAWCYYESRILGAHHGLISTYALETLVLYIFNVFDNSFSGPLEVLYRFLEFFSNFDWDNFCVSLWGPVPISSLPDVTAEPPRKDSGTLLLNKLFLDACSSVYAVFPAGQENYGQPFVSKHFNVIDPLRVNNNLGRSVSKGNFFRIRSAFAFGAKKLARLLDCPKESLVSEVNQFFTNTWGRHGSGNRPDAPGTNLWQLKLSSSHHLLETDESKSNTNGNNFSLGSPSLVIPNGCMSHLRSELLPNDTHGRFLLARTNSSPELTCKASENSNGSNHYQESGLDVPNGEVSSSASISGMQKEEDLVNIMATTNLNGFSGHVPVPFNLGSAHHHIPFSPWLASMGYNQHNIIDPSFADFQFSVQNMATEVASRSSGPQPVTSIPGFHESSHASSSDSTLPIAPDNSGLVAFYPTGPPVPFITMLSMYNMPQETGNSDASTKQDKDSTDTVAVSKELKSDILNSDFASHWQNLQFGRFCQHPRIENGPPIYPSPVMVPPVYLQGGFPMDGSGIPHSANMDIVSQLIGYGPRMQSMSSGPPNVYQYYVDEIPRQRSGTGTYLPNLKISPQERPSSGNRRYNRNENHSHREGNWNGKAKPRGQRYQGEKVKSRLDRLPSERGWNSHRHDSHHSYQSQNGSLRSTPTSNGPTNLGYGMRSFPVMRANGASPRGHDDPSVVMMYPFHHGEQLELGSVGPPEQSQLSEGSQHRGSFNDPKFHGRSGHRSHLDQPSSPHHRRRL